VKDSLINGKRKGNHISHIILLPGSNLQPPNEEESFGSRRKTQRHLWCGQSVRNRSLCESIDALVVGVHCGTTGSCTVNYLEYGSTVLVYVRVEIWPTGPHTIDLSPSSSHHIVNRHDDYTSDALRLHLWNAGTNCHMLGRFLRVQNGVLPAVRYFCPPVGTII
jgi:hypothetical protein